ncbi:MAG: TolC family protein [Longimicrobiales bacterium]
MRKAPGRSSPRPAGIGLFPVALPLFLLAVAVASPSAVAAQERPLDLEASVRLALEANPDFQSRLAALEATRAEVRGARSARYPNVGLSGSAARYENGGSGAMDRHAVGVDVRQILYQGGRVGAVVDAASATLDVDEGALQAARADLVLAVRQGWYRVAQGERLVRSAEEGLARSRLNLEYAEAQLAAGLGTRPDVLRARVDVSAAQLALTRASNARESARAVLNTLMGQSPSAPLTLAADEPESALPGLAPWDELKRTALDGREELRSARARTARQEALVRLARGSYLPSVTADAGVSRGAVASQDAERSWSLGVAFSLPLFDGFSRSADVQAQRARLDAVRFDEAAVAQGVEAEVWQAWLDEDESARRLENARALFAAATENLEAAQESYRQGLGSMIALVDARTEFTGAEQALIQAIYDRRIARAVLERVVEGDIFGMERP